MRDGYIPWVPRPRTMKWIARVHTALFRATWGLIGRRADGLDMLLLTTTGRRSGLARTAPLPLFRDGERLVLIGSFGGGDRDPAWIDNLRRDASVGVQLGRHVISASASIAEPEERGRLWCDITGQHPHYQVYQADTDRQIPLAIVEPSERV